MAKCSKCGKTLMEDAKCGNCHNSGIFKQSDHYECCYCRRRISGLEICDGKHYDWLTVLLLAIFLGGLGVHKFYVGRGDTGIWMLLLCWTGISLIWAIIDIVMIVMGEFKDGVGRVICRSSVRQFDDDNDYNDDEDEEIEDDDDE